MNLLDRRLFITTVNLASLDAFVAPLQPASM